MFHLTQRVAWHDNGWCGSVCNSPAENSYCIALDRIRSERMEGKEEPCKPWSEIPPDDLPPCKAESGGFMNSTEWVRRFVHPYSKGNKTVETHGHLEPKTLKIPPFSTFAVPFSWMLRENQKKIESSQPTPLPPDQKAPFKTPWVFGHARQEALLDLMFNKLTPQKSLVFFYTKEGHPLGDAITRLIVGVGRITHVGKIVRYDTDKSFTYPLWDRLIQHSIRPSCDDGFLLPYQDYLAPTGDIAEDARRRNLLLEIAVIPEGSDIKDFSYASETAGSDVALSTLVRCLDAVRKIREHGIASGPWEKREAWLNQQIALAWKERGAFPGVGPALEALGLPLGTSLCHDLISSGTISSNDNPWEIVDDLCHGTVQPPNQGYKNHIDDFAGTWIHLPEERRQLLLLLSRFNLTTAQATRWFNAKGNRSASIKLPVSDADILANPYVISELDLGDGKEFPVSVGVIDRGMLPDDTIRVQHPVPGISAIKSVADSRRIRAILVSVLSKAAMQGDSLLSINEALAKVELLDLAEHCPVTPDWINANKISLEGVVELVEIMSKTPGGQNLAAIQLKELKECEEYLRKVLAARASKALPSLAADWRGFIKAAIKEANGKFDGNNPRHLLALEEQSGALEKITTRKLTVLVGKAGTGKTSVLGGLLRCEKLKLDGILLLAPTGKARVRLGKATAATAMTIAQFLFSRNRFDGVRQRSLFTGKEPYRKEKTIIIDECSMLTLVDLCAVFKAIDMTHVERVILVGDPNQLPPIGVGRPFADFVGHLDIASESSDEKEQFLSRSLGRLTVEVRTSSDSPSDTLRLASWFTREPQPVDADRVLSDLEYGNAFNDLEICFWKTPDDLHKTLLKQIETHLRAKDVATFNTALGLNAKGMVPFEAPDGAENFQILSPVRMHPYGIYDLNRWVQGQFRKSELKKGREPWGMAVGNEEIVIRDKVIQVRNQSRNAYDWQEGEAAEDYLSNGEIGVVARDQNNYLSVAFAGRPNKTFSYQKSDFPGGKGPLELAYALTIHKAQGSEFKKVFVVLPKACHLVSRELLYTALTRSKEQLVLLIEGEDVSALYELTKPEKSETARRNSNLFVSEGAVRESIDLIPYAEHLIHRTDKGHMVRSKSELVISNKLFSMGMEYQYERVLEGSARPGKLRPDFSFADPAGELIVWEHLGMLGRDDYLRGWEWKKKWYLDNGYEEGVNLFTTFDAGNGGLDSDQLTKVAQEVQKLL